MVRPEEMRTGRKDCFARFQTKLIWDETVFEGGNMRTDRKEHYKRCDWGSDSNACMVRPGEGRTAERRNEDCFVTLRTKLVCGALFQTAMARTAA